MTHDFTEMLKEACEKEGLPYLIIIGTKDGKSARLIHDLRNWEQGPASSTIEDIRSIIDLVEGDLDEKDSHD